MLAAVLLGAAVLPAIPAPGAITATLTADPGAPGPTSATRPYTPATLTLDATDAPGTAVVRAVSLREVHGGPRFVYSLTLAPGTKQDLPVALPAVSQQQKYRVQFFAEELAEDRYPARVLGEAVAPIHWPQDHLSDLFGQEFLDPQAYQPWLENLPTWDQPLRRDLFLALAVTCLAGAGARLIRRAALRAAAVVLLAAAATTGLAWMLDNTQTIIQRKSPDASLVILQCRRTAVWQSRDTHLVPLYVDPWHMQQDDMVVRPGKGVRVRLDPSDPARQVRIFRRPAADGGG